MATLFDEQQIMDTYVNEMIEDSKEQVAKEMAYELHSSGVPDTTIAKAAKVSVATVSKWLTDPHTSSVT